MLIDTNLFSDGFSVFFLDFLMAWFYKSERLKPAESKNMILWWTSIITSLHCKFKTSKVKNKYACFIVFDNTSHPATLSPISSSRVFFWSELARTSLFAWKQIFLKKSVDGINNGQRSLLPAPRYRYSMPNLQCFCVFKTNSTVYNTTILTKPSQDIWIYVIMHWRLFLDVPCNFIVSGVAFLIHYITPCLSSIAVPLSGIGQFWPIL